MGKGHCLEDAINLAHVLLYIQKWVKSVVLKINTYALQPTVYEEQSSSGKFWRSMKKPAADSWLPITKQKQGVVCAALCNNKSGSALLFGLLMEFSSATMSLLLQCLPCIMLKASVKQQKQNNYIELTLQNRKETRMYPWSPQPVRQPFTI